MAYQHILAAVDLGPESDEVLAAARQLADEHEARLSVLTVVKPLVQIYGGLDLNAYTRASTEFEAEARAAAERQLRDKAATLGVAAGDSRVAVGHPGTQITQSAEALGVDLIVVGSHGKHGLGLLLGSTANAVLHQAGCDVLTVRIR